SSMHWKFRLAGTPISRGLMVSCTLVTWKAMLVFLHLSTAVQMFVIKNGQGRRLVGLNASAKPPLLVMEKLTVTRPSQLSMPVTLDGGSTSLMHCTFRLGGTPTRSGLMVSCTLMTWKARLVLLQWSTAVQILVR